MIEEAAVGLVVGLLALLVRCAAGFSVSRGRRLRVVDRPSPCGGQPGRAIVFGLRCTACGLGEWCGGGPDALVAVQVDGGEAGVGGFAEVEDGGVGGWGAVGVQVDQ